GRNRGHRRGRRQRRRRRAGGERRGGPRAAALGEEPRPLAGRRAIGAMIDVHAHYMPRPLVERLQTDGARYGVSVIETEPACHALHFAYGLRLRPFFAKLIEEPAQRLASMAAAVELGAPVFLHPAQPTPTPRTRRFAMNQVVQYTVDTTLCVGSLIGSGVLDRFPRLDLILSHGGGTLPYLIGRFDVMFERS